MFQKPRIDDWSALYDEYGARVYRFSHRLTRNAADAEDLTQEVFVAAYQGLSAFGKRSSLVTWLYRIALFRWRAQCRRSAPDSISLDGLNGSGPSTPDPATASLNGIRLEWALSELPESLRTAFVLVKAEGLTCREAAEVLQIPQGTVKFHVHEAVTRLRQLLSQDENNVSTSSSTSLPPEVHNEV